MPATRRSTTGMWRKRQRVIVSMIFTMVSFSSQVATSLSWSRQRSAPAAHLLGNRAHDYRGSE